ncbi:MAG: MerR family transcriptional regulator [Angustibacter sp.]
MANRTWTIAQLAAEFGVTHRTIRYYEDQGLLAPERRGNTRVFHPRDRARLTLVLRGKRLGFPLDQIRRIVDMYDDPPGHQGQLRYLLDQIDERRAELLQRRRDVAAALRELADLERRCQAELDRLRPGAQKVGQTSDPWPDQTNGGGTYPRDAAPPE